MAELKKMMEGDRPAIEARRHRKICKSFSSDPVDFSYIISVYLSHSFTNHNLKIKIFFVLILCTHIINSISSIKISSSPIYPLYLITTTVSTTLNCIFTIIIFNIIAYICIMLIDHHYIIAITYTFIFSVHN